MAWPKETRYLGKASPRFEGPAKVTGRARFTSDVAPAGVLYGAILRSIWPSARVHAIDLTKALAAPGVKAAIAVKDGEFDVNFYGQELAAVAAVSRQAALDALALITVKATTRPFVVKELDAIKPDAPSVAAGKPNLNFAQAKDVGDVDAAFAAAAAVVEGTYETQVEIHQPLESHGHVVSWSGDEMTAWSSTQAVYGSRDAFANALGIPQNKVRVICEHMGGGFGSKFGPNIEGLVCARLAQAAGAPVKLMLSRFEQALGVGNRPSSFQKIKLAADAQGKLTAFQLESFGTAGFSSGGSSAGGSGRASIPAPYIYKPAATRVKQGSVAVNAGLAGPMRAPGHPVASAGIEAALDDLAVKLGIDPVEIRLKNDPFDVRRKEYQLGAEKFAWKRKYHKPGDTPGPIKRGIGCAGAAWVNGNRPSQIELQANADGTVEARIGTQDLGTGSRTVVQVVAAELLGIDRNAVDVQVGDTTLPFSGASGGSVTTVSITPAIFDGCENLLTELKKASGIAEPRGAKFKEACGKLRNMPLRVIGRWKEGLSSTGAGGVQFAEVEVDTETGFVKVHQILVVQDCGLVVNKLTCESQINGGVIMGIGYALYEQRVMDSATGVVLNPNFETYKLPGAADIPRIEIMLLDMPERGVIGVGEPCTIPTASAIANAVANAIGVRVPSLPITPDKVLAALGKVPPSARERVSAAERARAFAAVAALPAQGGEERIA